MKQTVLHDSHIRRSARMSEHQGWIVPERFGDPSNEYHAVRTAAGLFDVGFLGRIEVTGNGATRCLETLFSRPVAAMTEGSCRYGLFCDEQGHLVDAVLLFHLPGGGRGGPGYLITASSPAASTVLSRIEQHSAADVRCRDLTGSLAQLSLQGPRADGILEILAGPSYRRLRQRRVAVMTIEGISVTVSRSGFTGGRGYELFAPADRASQLWDRALAAGAQSGLVPCGSICREVLRIEAGYLQTGKDIDTSRSPLGTHLMRFVDLRKEFIGRDALLKLVSEGARERFVGFELLDKGVPKQGAVIYSDSREIGAVTSSIHSYHRRRDIGLGYVGARYAQPSLEIEIEVKEREIAAKIVDLPFYHPR